MYGLERRRFWVDADSFSYSLAPYSTRLDNDSGTDFGGGNPITKDEKRSRPPMTRLTIPRLHRAIEASEVV